MAKGKLVSKSTVCVFIFSLHVPNTICSLEHNQQLCRDLLLRNWKDCLENQYAFRVLQNDCIPVPCFVVKFELQLRSAARLLAPKAKVVLGERMGNHLCAFSIKLTHGCLCFFSLALYFRQLFLLTIKDYFQQFVACSRVDCDIFYPLCPLRLC